MEVFQDYAYYYNTFYEDKDYKAEAQKIHSLLDRYGNNIKHIVNFGCGTGRHDIELAEMGYLCTGIDMSGIMIDIAKEHARAKKVNIDFSVDDIRKYVGKSKCDAVISLFHVMSYQNTNKDILESFQSARRALNSGGLFLFDVWYGPGVLSDKPVVRVKEVQGEKHKFVRIARPIMHDKTNVVDVCYEVLVIDRQSGETRVIDEVHSMRYFFRPELEFLLEEAGFRLMDNIDCKSLKETDYSSWTSYFIAKAI